MSNGDTGSKKGNWMKEAKELRKVAADFEMTPEQMREALKQYEENRKMPGDLSVSVAVSPPGVATLDTDAAVDPLDWITDETPFVALVMKPRSITVRPGKPRWNPPMDTVRLHAWTTAPWPENPFPLKHEDRDMERNLKVRYSRWEHYRITQDNAYDVYAGDPRYTMPAKAVIDPADFKGWDSVSWRAKGRMSPTSGVRLRELVRHILQRKANQCFVSMSVHLHDVGLNRVGIVNPYGNRLEGINVRVERHRDDELPVWTDAS